MSGKNICAFPSFFQQSFSQKQYLGYFEFISVARNDSVKSVRNLFHVKYLSQRSFSKNVSRIHQVRCSDHFQKHLGWFQFVRTIIFKNISWVYLFVLIINDHFREHLYYFADDHYRTKISALSPVSFSNHFHKKKHLGYLQFIPAIIRISGDSRLVLRSPSGITK